MATKTATVQSGQVTGTHSNFPVYIDLAAVGITTLAQAQSVRVYTDAGLTTEIAREIVSATECHAKVPSLTTTTQLWVDYDGIRSDYAVTDTYGRNAVWASYEFCAHLNSTTDSAGKHNLTEINGVVAGGISGKIANATDFDGTNDNLRHTTTTFGAKNAFSVQAWIKPDALLGSIFVNHDGISFGTFDFGLYINTDGSTHLTVCTGTSAAFYKTLTSPTSLISVGNYYKITATRNSSSGVIYVNGASVVSGTPYTTGTTRNLAMVGIGSNGTHPSGYYNGIIDEVRLPLFAVSGDWELTEYNNQNNVGAFWGTWADAGGGATRNALFFGGGI